MTIFVIVGVVIVYSFLPRILSNFPRAKLGGAVFADVTSANVVGYSNKDIANGKFNVMCSMFDNVGGKVTKLGDITANDNFISSTLQIINPDNGVTMKFDSEVFGPATSGLFTYWPEEFVGDIGQTEPGWYIVSDDFSKSECYNNLEIPFGSGFLVNGADEGAFVIFAGEVVNQDITVDVINGKFNYFGNCTPVKLNLGDIIANDNFISSTLQIINPNNGVTQKFDSEVFGPGTSGLFTYWPEEFVGDIGQTVPGWYIVSDDFSKSECYNGEEIAAGMGFLVNGADEGATITIPAAL